MSESKKSELLKVLVPVIGSIVVAAVTGYYSVASAIADKESKLSEIETETDSLEKRVEEAKGALAGVPVGTIVPYGGPLNEARLQRQGWLPCDGRNVSRTEYQSLFETIGESWGRADGVNDFALPDLRGRFIRGVDAGAGRDPEATGRREAANGGNTGDQVGTVQDDAFQQHGHRYNYISDAGSGDHRHPTDRFNDQPDNHVDNRVGDVVGAEARASTETRPKNANVFWVIRAK